MRYVIVILLLASPAFAAEPVYSWRTRADDPNRVYLYRDGQQVGGWDYRVKQYRTFDGTNWGAPVDAAPVRPPEQHVAMNLQLKPMVITLPSAPSLPMRGPLQVGLGAFMGQIFTDMTMKMIEAIPGAMADSLMRGDYKLDFKSPVTPSPQQPVVLTTPPTPSQPARGPLRRWLIPRP